MKMYILEDKKAVVCDDLTEWAKWMGLNSKKVLDTRLPTGEHISTVFLGMDHNHFGGKPLLFETMIFGGQQDGFQERCSTWEEAEARHKIAIELIFQA